MWYDILRVCCKAHVCAAILVAQLSLFSGFTKAFSAILISQLEKPGSSIVININQASWIASVGAMCQPIGALFLGLIVDKYGRKTCIQLSLILFTGAWFFMFFAENVFSLYIGRIVTGVAMGMEHASGMYITEISSPSERGTLSSLMAPITATGSLMVYVLGYLLHWRYVSLIFAVYGLLLLTLLWFIPESPVWYILRNRKLKAIKSLSWIRNDNKSLVNSEIEEMESNLPNVQGYRLKDYIKFFKDKSIWKPFSIFLIFALLQESSGQDVIYAYAIDFFALFETNFDTTLLSVMYALISLVGSLNIMIVAHKFDRTNIILVSGLSMSASLLVGAICFKSDAPVVTVCCVFLFIYSSMSGMKSVPYIVMAELFPSRARGVMSSAVCMLMFLPNFLNIKLYPTLLGLLQPTGLLCWYSIFAFSAAVFAKLCIPETRGRTLFEIEEYFK